MVWPIACRRINASCDVSVCVYGWLILSVNYSHSLFINDRSIDCVYIFICIREFCSLSSTVRLSLSSVTFSHFNSFVPTDGQRSITLIFRWLLRYTLRRRSMDSNEPNCNGGVFRCLRSTGSCSQLRRSRLLMHGFETNRHKQPDYRRQENYRAFSINSLIN